MARNGFTANQTGRPKPAIRWRLALALAAALVLCLILGGCGGEPELQVAPREVAFWPAEQSEAIRRDPQQRFFGITQLPPQVFFRPGDECGTVRHLSIQIDGWPAATAPTAAPVTMPLPSARYYVSDRQAGPAARFDPARALEWEPRGGREVVEVRATAAGDSPTPVPQVRFEPGWLYRLTFLADLGERSYQRSIWMGPAGWQERALLWDGQ